MPQRHGAYGAARGRAHVARAHHVAGVGAGGHPVNTVAPDGMAAPRVKANFTARGAAGMEHLARDTSLKRHAPRATLPAC